MSRLVTILGVITAVAFAVAPELTRIDASVARYVMLAGVGAAALGKALVAPPSAASPGADCSPAD